jgi:hypothetical protein
MKQVLRAIAIVLALYLCTAFIKCEYNASKWDESQRGAMVMLSIMLIGILHLKEELD